MIKSITAKDISNNNQNAHQYEPVKQCPICKTSFNGTYFSAFTHTKNFYDNLYVLHFCHACERPFLGLYSKHSGLGKTPFDLEFCCPNKFENLEFPNLIEEISPNFVEIYNQALEAEECQLTEICGLGYRKALEVLIKDFAINQNPNSKDEILSCPLVKCIKNHIQYPKIQTVAERAVWLGNDHAHYLAKHTEYDLRTLKQLVNLTVHWITMELETIEAETIQPK